MPAIISEVAIGKADEGCGKPPPLIACLPGTAAPAARLYLTGAPGSTRYWPAVTTRSPATAPASTTAGRPPVSPTLISRSSALLSLLTT